MVEKAYEVLCKKYKLPDYATLDKEFSLSTIEDVKNLSVSIRQKMIERIEPVIEFVEHLIQPGTNSLADMYECKYIDAEDKSHLFGIYKKLMKVYRTFFELELLQNEKEDCHFIANFPAEWEKMKDELVPIIIKIKTCWSEPTESREVLEYLG